eukprot:scaffold29195_cov69-Cyclotella_meneghiniana.AAC.6
MSKRTLFLFALCSTILQYASPFSFNRPATSHMKKAFNSRKAAHSFESSPSSPKINDSTIDTNKMPLATALVHSIASIPLMYPTIVSAADDYEVAELPPVYVPILFAIAIIGGVGVLTASLGDVMNEEASLGLQSGARAKKERDRSRSSYFKK